MALAVAQPAQAQEESVKFVDHAESMAGITRMRVIVEDIPVLKGKLPTAALKEATELRLQQAGINIDATSGGRLPWLYINVNALETPRGYVYSVQVSFSCYLEIPTLDLDVVKFVRGETWRGGTIGTTPPNDTRAIQKAIDDQVTGFLNVYQSANSGRGSRARLD